MRPASRSVDWAFGQDRLKPCMANADPLVQPLIVRYCIEEVQRRGLNPASLLAGLGFSTHDLTRPDFRLRYTQASEAIWRIASTLDDPDLGLLIGQRHNITSWGLVGLGAMASPTMGEAIAFGLRHQEEAGSLLSLRIKKLPQHMALVASPRYADVTIERFLVDGIFAAIVQAARLVVGQQFKPKAVELMSRRIGSLDLYHRIFKCPVLFSCAENRVVVAPDAVDDTVDSANSAVLKMASAALLRERPQLQDYPFARSAVEAALLDRLQAPPAPSDLASSLGVNERTLRRKLAQEGTSYNDILDAMRRSRALELHLIAQRPASEIAAELGFINARSLGRAFKRWTGHPLHGP